MQTNIKNELLFLLCSGANQHLVSFLRVPAKADGETETVMFSILLKLQSRILFFFLENEA